VEAKLRVTGSANPTDPFPDVALDAFAAGLLGGFVGLLFLGFFDPDFPYDSLAAIPLLGSLALLFWTNRRADRIARSLSAPPDT